MTTPIETLTLTHWLSPAFPTGGFAYSQGLEAVVAAGWVRDAAGLGDWLADLLRHGALASDARLIAAACQGVAPLAEIDAIARAFAPSAERLRESVEQGRALAAVLDPVWGTALAGLVYPVALGAAARARGLDLDLLLALFLQGTLSTLVAAGQRLAPIGQTAAQGLIRDLSAEIAATVDAVRDGDLGGLASACFLADVASQRHEALEPRLFRS